MKGFSIFFLFLMSEKRDHSFSIGAGVLGFERVLFNAEY